CSLVWLELLLLSQQPLSRLCALGRMSRWLKRCGDYFRRRPLRILTASVTTGLRGVVTLRTNKESLEHCISDSTG
ncbi:hypothetical protein HID58_013452, partial [Brassica napus]